MVDNDDEHGSTYEERWMEGLNENGNYWEGVVSNVDLVLWHHNLATVTCYHCYGTRTPRKVIQNNKVNKIANKENLMVSNMLSFFVLLETIKYSRDNL